MIDLNPQQQNAVDMSEKWWKSFNKQTFEISGPAGSGKTTIVYELIRKLGLKHDEVLFMAYVGKATMALALKGNFAKTIHSTIYDLVPFAKKDEEGNIITKNGRALTGMAFELKEQLPSNIKLLVVDEGSMLDKNIALDVLSFGLPVLVLGDLNQLPPVFGAPYFLQKPDCVLTMIMRQAENNPIIHLSQKAIKGQEIKLGQYGEKCFVIPKEKLTDQILKSADAIICGRNSTRQNINDYYRQQILGIKSKIPVYGDKVICRRNNWKLSIDENIFLINGLIGYIENIHLDTYNKKSINIDFRPEFMDSNCFENIPIDFEFLFQDIGQPGNSKMSWYNQFQFAYAITCHLAQGSQYDNVLVYNESVGSWDYRRKWLYTAITRAVHGLVLAV